MSQIISATEKTGPGVHSSSLSEALIDELHLAGYRVSDSRPSVVLADTIPRESLFTPAWSSAFGSLSSFTKRSATHLTGNTNLFIGPWSAKGGYLHAADALPAVEGLASMTLLPSESITGLANLTVNEPIVTNLAISVKRHWDSTATRDPSEIYPAALTGEFTTTSGIPISFEGDLNSQEFTHTGQINPFARQLTRRTRLVADSDEGSFHYALSGSQELLDSFPARVPGLLTSTVIDVVNTGMHLFRLREFPDSPAILMRSIKDLNITQAVKMLSESCSVQMDVTRAPGNGGYICYNATFQAIDSQGSKICSASSEMVVPEKEATYQKLIRRSKKRRDELLGENSAPEKSDENTRETDRYPDKFLAGEAADPVVLRRHAFDLRSGAFFDNPYQFYDVMRSDAPAIWLDRSSQGITPRWFATDHALCEAILRDKDSFGRTPHRESRSSENSVEWSPHGFSDLRRRFMLFLSPPKHTEVRTIFNKLFSSTALGDLKPGMAATAESLLATGRRTGQLDLIKDYAEPMALTSIGAIMGIGAEEIAELQPLCMHLTQANGLTVKSGDHARASEVAPYLIERMKQCMPTAPKGSVLQHAAELCRPGSELPEGVEVPDILASSLFLLVAGYQTTVNLIGNTAYALLKSPEQQRQLRADPGLIRAAVDEGARFDPSVQLVVRTVLKDVDNLHGASFRAGEKVSVVIGAANRDPSVFDSPHTFDLARENLNRSLSYGAGIHTCIGTKAARLEAMIALENLFRDSPFQLNPVDEPKRRADPTLRGFSYLPVYFD